MLDVGGLIRGSRRSHGARWSAPANNVVAIMHQPSRRIEGTCRAWNCSSKKEKSRNQVKVVGRVVGSVLCRVCICVQQ